DDGRRLVGEAVVAIGPAGPVDGVLQSAGDGPVIFRGDEKKRVHCPDGILEGPCHGWEIGIIVVAVERQIGERDLGEGEILRRQPDKGAGQLAVDGLPGKAADQVANLVMRHGRGPFMDEERRRKGGGAQPSPMPSAGSGAAWRRTASSIRWPTS